MISGGLTAAFKALVPVFEKETGNKVLIAYGPSMGTTVNAIPVRLDRGEPADVLIMVGYALTDLGKKGKVVPGSRGRAGALADRRRGEERRAEAGHQFGGRGQARAARGQDHRLFRQRQRRLRLDRDVQKLGIEKEMKGKARKIPATPVGEIVAKGDAELGFQQISELKPVAGIDIVGPLPADLQKITIFSAGIATGSKEPDAGKALIKFLASPAARDEIVKSGMEPIAVAATH